MEKIVSLCKRRGFVFPSSEIYGGIGSTYDYGHYGVLLKQNVKDAWWRAMLQQRDDVVALDAAIIMHPRTWEASGHLAGFTDPLVDCRTCKLRFRADHLQEVLYWTLGGLGAARWDMLALPAITLVAGTAVLLTLARPLDLLPFGQPSPGAVVVRALLESNAPPRAQTRRRHARPRAARRRHGAARRAAARQRSNATPRPDAAERTLVVRQGLTHGVRAALE
jgi:hypothetical protein